MLIKNMPKTMKQLYSAIPCIEQDPEHVKGAQELTLDPEFPDVGLKGTFGLFGSAAWISNLKKGVIPRQTIMGRIVRVYATNNMDGCRKPNVIDIKVDESNEIFMEWMHLNVKSQKKYYRVGKEIHISYYIEELKSIDEQTGQHDQLKCVYEIYVET